MYMGRGEGIGDDEFFFADVTCCYGERLLIGLPSVLL